MQMQLGSYPIPTSFLTLARTRLLSRLWCKTAVGFLCPKHSGQDIALAGRETGRQMVEGRDTIPKPPSSLVFLWSPAWQRSVLLDELPWGTPGSPGCVWPRRGTEAGAESVDPHNLLPVASPGALLTRSCWASLGPARLGSQRTGTR